MSFDPGSGSQSDPGSFQSCLVEGSAEQRSRERRIKRRALTISIAIQTAMVAAIILVPLFGKPERLVMAKTTPIPPYYPSRAPEQPPQTPQTPVHHVTVINDQFFTPDHIPSHVSTDPGPTQEPEPPGILPGLGLSAPCAACIPLVDSRPQPQRPADLRPHVPPRIVRTHLEQAMLLQRVEPVYPALARQIRREGRVELHAIIATDGTVKSLQVVSGDPLLVRSAFDAVSQWRYHPTILDGQPVEVDTYITATYVLQQ